MEAVFLKLLNMSITAGWLVLAVVLLRFILKKAPKSIRRVLWALVGIRLICPFSIESFLSLIPSTETVPPASLYSETPVIHSGISAFNKAINPIISESLASVAEASINPMQVITYVASLVWLIGMAVMALYSVISCVRLRWRLAEAVPLKDNLWQSEAVVSPFILGLFRPRIYLSFGMDEESMAHVVAHEREHLKRCDHWIKPIGFLLLAIYWFNPLIWLAYILLCRDIELACDERVVKQMGTEDKKAYSEALLSCSVPHRAIAACPLAFGEVGVKQRIQNVLNYKRPALWIIIVALVSCVVVAVCFLTNPASNEAQEVSSHSESDSLPANHKDALLGGIYVFDKCIYMNPLSSFYPSNGTGYRYLVGSDSFTIQDEATGEELESYIDIEWNWQSISNSEWKEMFQVDFNVPDISIYNKPLMLKLSGKNYLFNMDGRLWLAQNNGGKVGMWSVYALTPEGAGARQADKKYTDLEACISSAILDYNKSGRADVDFACESHVTLANEGGGPADGSQINTVTVYAMVLYQEYAYVGGGFSEVGGSHIPTAITFDVNEDGEYSLREYWIPRDGSYYMPDIKEKFPEAIWDDALDTQKFILVQIQSCYAQAVGYGKVDTEGILNKLFETIMSSPATSSNPYDYIKEHPIEYRELTYYGNYTLRYVFSEFLKGGQTGLKGHIMRSVMDELIGGEAIKLTVGNGQEYFDKWSEHVQRIERENGSEYMMKNMPKSYLLLQMLDEASE